MMAKENSLSYYLPLGLVISVKAGHDSSVMHATLKYANTTTERLLSKLVLLYIYKKADT